MTQARSDVNRLLTLIAMACAITSLAMGDTSVANDERSPRSWLEPCDSLETATSQRLEIHKRRIVVLGIDRWPYSAPGNGFAMLLAQPSFSSDWVVSLNKLPDRGCVVVATVADENIYYANYKEKGSEVVLRRKPARVGAETNTESIPCPIAKSIGTLWQQMIRMKRLPEPTGSML